MARNPSSRRLLVLATLCALVLGGCAHGKQAPSGQVNLAVENLAGQGTFVAPPRHIDDILGLLSGQTAADAPAVAKLKAAAEAPEPSWEKAEALWELGRYQQAKAVLGDVSRAGADKDWRAHRATLLLAKADIESGNFREGIALLERLRDVTQQTRRMAGWRSGMYASLVRAYLQVGQFDQAKAVAGEGLEAIKSMPAVTDKFAGAFAAQHTADIQAMLYEAAGRSRESEVQIRAALAVLDVSLAHRPVEAITHRLWLARNLVHQERLLNAEIEARRALKDAVAQAGAGSGKVAQAAQVLGEVILAQGRQAEARRLAETVIAILVGSGYPADSFEISQARVFWGSVLTGQGDYAGAVEQFDQARASMGDNAYFQKRLLGANPDVALSLIEMGRGDQVLAGLTQAYETSRERMGEGNYHVAEFLALRGAALARAGRLEEAVRDFRQAMPALMGRGMGENADVGRINRLRALMLEYLDLLAAIQGRPVAAKLGLDAAAEAFQASDLWAGRSVRQALAASAARAAADVPGLAELIRQEQDAGNRLAVVQGVLLNLVSAPGPEQSPEDIRQVASQVTALDAAGQGLRQEIARRFPRYADFVSPTPPRAEVVRGVLRPGEALVVFVPGPRRLYVLALTGAGRTRLAAVDVGAKALEEQVVALRRALDIEPAGLDDIPAFDLALAARLYDTLLRPVADVVDNAPELLIVAGGPLGRLPFATLLAGPARAGADRQERFDHYRGQPWLAERSAVAMLPSAASLVMLRGLPRPEAGRKPFLGFGDPYFTPAQARQAETETPARPEAQLRTRGVRDTPRGNLDGGQLATVGLEQLERLPDTRQEVLTIARVLGADPAQDVFLGKKASRAVARQANLADRRVVVFATHALVPGDLDGLDQPALALSPPSVTGQAADGPLTMDDILKFKLNADWVTLSACNTGAAQGAGAEAASGLGRAFFYAGARSLLVSQWAVESVSAARLTTGLFEAQGDDPGLSRAMALRRSMSALRDGPGLAGGVPACYAHPFFWAPFILLGDPGGN